MIVVFILVTVLILFISRNLLLTLILLEVLSFIVIYYIAFYFGFYALSDYFVLIGFSIFVIEGVIALCGLIILVRFRGRDYLVRSSFLKY